MSQDRYNETQQSAGYNQGLNPNAAAMFRASQGPPSVQGMMGGVSNGNPMGMGPNPMGSMLPNVNVNANGGVGADQQQAQASLHMSNEIKRLQQLHQMGNSTPANALLMTGSQQHRQNDGSAAFLQSMFDQQQKAQNQHPGGASGFEEALRQNLANPNQMMQSGFLQDARFLMAQNQLNPMVAQQQNQLNPGMQSLSSMQAPGPGNMQAPGQQQPQATQSEIPLPSPHALFHRDGSRRMRGGVIEPFPEKLHRLLMEVEAAGLTDVISFVANGRAFAIHKPDKFFKEIVPLYFRQSRLSSFKRQLNLYGFELINTGPARGGYYHEMFVKDSAEQCRRMRRVVVKVVASSDKDTAKEEKGSTTTNRDDVYALLQ
jgi:hypothetical protein